MHPVGRGANTSSLYKISLLRNVTKGPRTSTDSLEKRPKLRKMDVTFGTWNIRSLYRAGSLITVAKNYQNISWI
jgi:hypothetical protein